MTADPLGGVWTYALELSRGLAARGARVSLAVEGAPLSNGQRRDLQSLPVESWWSSTRKLEWMEDPWDDVDATGAWLQEIASESRPDVVHVNSFSHASLEWSSPVVLTAHSCVRSWWREVKGEDAPPEWNTYARRVESGLRGATIVAAPTGSFLDELKPLYEFETPTAIVPNGLDPIRAGDSKSPLILTAGRVWDEAKNIGLLETVAARLAWPVVVLGEGGRDAAENMSQVGKVGRREVRRWMQDAAIFCAPARYEPFGLAALEAGGAGCALILGDIPTLREVWADAAIFVDPDDASELLRTCSLLIHDDGLREEFGAKAQRRAENFRSDRMVRGYLDLYRRLTESVSARRRVPVR